MGQEHSIDTRTLLTCFFAVCEDAFRFLEREHGFEYCAGLATYAGGRQIIRPYHHENIATPFFAVTRYEKENTSIEITYGDTDYSIGIHLCPDRIHRFTMQELCRAAGKRFKSCNTQKILTSAEIEHAIRVLAENLRHDQKTLVNTPETVVRKTAMNRAREMEKRIREQFRKNLKDSIRRAAKAFSEENHRVVIALLMPYEQYLKGRDLKKLQIARQHLTT